ncbi:conjugal transfer protein [Desemzia sp. RIT804]|uniref:TrsD/TraD family conjugative transfer protein n=1 Tax=Desemzia sp. RIT 804 TaxID=2810209 RepID=UPI00194FE523|nr:TrsD/TraD family conjugative transfer protein [Desemzia sp. RIT 804]MBM6613975.1 conjugal transfer protein [Desemzia sp. RIT 804]MBM6614058.1 conjugal transfer protein [Desemzia sp. RIT 804]MBM6614141.1 conjugal transfer protein [Desemzia sp. RIT 804]
MKLFGLAAKETKVEQDLEFTFVPKKIGKGKQTIFDMSLIQSVYRDYLVTKTGYLVGIIEISGVNLELLNESEQADVFETYNAFLMTTLGDASAEQQQYLDMTIPVDFEEFLLSYKKRYLQEIEKKEPNQARAILIASYIDDLASKTRTQEMSTKKHLLIVREKIKDKTFTSLNKKVTDLDEKTTQYINRLEDSFDSYDMQAKKLHSNEILAVLKNLINFSGH